MVAREDIPLVGLVENESPNGDLSSPSHNLSSPGKVKLGLEDCCSSTFSMKAIDELNTLDTGLNGMSRMVTSIRGVPFCCALEDSKYQES